MAMFFSVLFVVDDDYEVEEGAKKSSVVSFCSSGLFFCFCEILSMMMLWGQGAYMLSNHQ